MLDELEKTDAPMVVKLVVFKKRKELLFELRRELVEAVKVRLAVSGLRWGDAFLVWLMSQPLFLDGLIAFL